MLNGLCTESNDTALPLTNLENTCSKAEKRRIRVTNRVTNRVTSRVASRITNRLPSIFTSFLTIMMLSFLYFRLADCTQLAEDHRIQYTDDEKRILRHLFLKRFGLDQLVESRPAQDLNAPEVPDYIWQLYEEAQDGESDEIVRHYFPTPTNNGDRLQFDLHATNRRPNEEHIEHADLRLQLSTDQSRMRGQLNVYDGLGRLLDSHSLPQLFSRDNWLDLNVTSAIRAAKGNQVEFTLEFVPSDSSLSQIYQMPRLNDKAALVTYVQTTIPGTKPRRKRNANLNGARNQRKHRKHRKHHNTIGPRDSQQCRRTKLYVDFSELSWDSWIVAPAGYDAYQCVGKCIHPMPSHLNTTNHAIIQSLIHSIDPSAVPPPSCVPTETGSISILYKDVNNTVVVKNYADMRVEACGCQ